MKNNEVLKEFGNYIGVKNMSFDIHGSCSLLIGKENVIIINNIQDTSLMLSCVVGPISQTHIDDSATALELLSVNMLFASQNGPYVGYEPKNQALMLSVTNHQEEMTPVIFESQINYLIRSKEQVKKTLEERGIFLQ